MNSIGIIQGRLSKRPYPKLQEFPFETWEQEFKYASEIGFEFIEWIFEENRYNENPIWTSSGRKKINQIINSSGVKVESLCADYFLERPFFRRCGYSLEENISMLKEVIKKASEIGVKTILLPVLEGAEIRNKEEKDILYEAILNCIETLEKNNMKLGFETELVAKEYLDLAKMFNNKNIGIYYDAGNCTAKGYDMKKDMEILKDHLINVHVKDRKVNGPSVFLGTGDTNFQEGIPYLIETGFKGSFVLQTYYEDDYRSISEYNRNYIEKLVKGIE